MAESMVPTMLRKVVLPPPDGPLMMTNSPLLTAPYSSSPERVMFLSARTGCYFLSLYSLARDSHSMRLLFLSLLVLNYLRSKSFLLTEILKVDTLSIAPDVEYFWILFVLVDEHFCLWGMVTFEWAHDFGVGFVEGELVVRELLHIILVGGIDESFVAGFIHLMSFYYAFKNKYAEYSWHQSISKSYIS